ncbi:MAG: sulfatase-like hydrolase/transferase, partial [Candidatus Methylomirabilis sp.]|nr:sulfatase-like hydrolase/transferase [Deltaproteobacteria bacterium]
YAVPNLFHPNRIANYENLGYGEPDALLKAADAGSPTADEQRAALLQWLKQNGDRRFFVWFHDAKLHLPYDPPAVHLEKFSKYTRDQLDRTSPGVHAVLNQVIVPAGSVAWRPTDREHVVDLYDAEVAEADAFLGEVLDALRAGGALDRTIVIVTADHGEELFDHGEVGHASTTGQATLYDELVRVPLVVRYPPSVMARRVEYAQVRTIDVAPTVLALLGKPAPAEMQGFPLKAALEGKLFSTRPAYSETNLGGYPSTPEQQAARLRSIRDGDWKMICRFDEQESCRLFNLRDDPGETRNVVAMARSKAKELRGELDQWAPAR